MLPCNRIWLVALSEYLRSGNGKQDKQASTTGNLLHRQVHLWSTSHLAVSIDNAFAIPLKAVVTSLYYRLRYVGS